MKSSKINNLSRSVLIIAGSDPSGGAGIQADLKTLTSLGVYGMTAITALTVQNTIGVSDIHEIPLDIVKKQIWACLSDIHTNTIKIGMMHNAKLIIGIYEALENENVFKNQITKTLLDKLFIFEDIILLNNFICNIFSYFLNFTFILAFNHYSD